MTTHLAGNLLTVTAEELLLSNRETAPCSRRCRICHSCGSNLLGPIGPVDYVVGYSESGGDDR